MTFELKEGAETPLKCLVELFKITGKGGKASLSKNPNFGRFFCWWLPWHLLAEEGHLNESVEEGTQCKTEPPGLDGRRSILEKQRSPLPTEITTINTTGWHFHQSSKEDDGCLVIFSLSLFYILTILQIELWFLLVLQYPCIVLHVSNF